MNLKRVFIVKLIVIVFILISSVHCVSYADESVDAWTTCQLPKYGVKFSCDYKWPTYEHGEATTFVISKNPNISVTVAFVETNFKFVHQLTKQFFKDQNVYVDGFVVLNEEISKKPCLRVQAFSQFDPQIRLVDYFFFNHGRLIRIMFTISPKETWSDFQYGIDRIVKSIELF